MSGEKEYTYNASDAPIQSAERDALGRKDFAWQLAEHIQRWKITDNLVLGLYGDWGSGKSSVKNMVVEKLRETNSSGIEILEFNPWQISGQDQLIEGFLHELGLAVAPDFDSDPERKKRAELWKKYSGYFLLGSKVADSLKFVLPLLGVPGAPLLDIAKNALSRAGDLSGEGTGLTEPVNQSLDSLKAELRESLMGLKKKVFVVIDDLDRLTPDEICTMFRLVKANADFPNLIFLLLCQRSIAEEALNRICDGKGSEFLDKIVQVGFDLPHVQPARIHRVLHEELDLMLGDPGTVGFEQERWHNLWIDHLSHYFTNLRQVFRYLNSFSFMVRGHLTDDTLEVNPIDLITLEVLRVHEPEVYRSLSSMKNYLLGQFMKQDEDGLRKAWEAIVSTARSETSQEHVNGIITSLFPRFGYLYSKMEYGSDWDAEWTRLRRVCIVNFFDRYFALTLSEDQVSEAEIRLFCESSEDRGRMVEILRKWIDEGTIIYALERLESEERLDVGENSLPRILAMSDIADDLPPDRIGFLLRDGAQFVSAAQNRVLDSIGEENGKKEVIERIVRESVGLLHPIRTVARLMGDRNLDSIQPAFDVTELSALKAVVLDRIREWRDSGSLSGHRSISTILDFWRGEHEDETKAWVSDMLEDLTMGSALIKGYIHDSIAQTLGSHYVRKKPQINLSRLEALAPLEDWESVVAELEARDDLDDELKEVVVVFRKAQHRRERGLPDNDWSTREDDFGVVD